MLFRAARESDIPDIKDVHVSVKENQRSDSTTISDAEYKKHIFQSGKCWLCVINEKVVGFGVVDLEDHNLWALFVHPDHLQKGIGSHLHDLLINWYFASEKEPLWLTSEPKSTVGQLYLSKGWINTGIQDNGEVRFELSSQLWNQDQADLSTVEE